MITTVYLVRHAEPNFYNHNDMDRELTPKGLQDCQLLLNYFSKQNIHVIYSISPTIGISDFKIWTIVTIKRPSNFFGSTFE